MYTEVNLMVITSQMTLMTVKSMDHSSLLIVMTLLLGLGSVCMLSKNVINMAIFVYQSHYVHQMYRIIIGEMNFDVLALVFRLLCW